jgi:hypothetical protein
MSTVPNWINVNELVPAYLRMEMAAVTKRLNSEGASLEDELLAIELDDRWHDEISGKDGVDDDDLFNRIMEWTGYVAFDDARLAAGIHPDVVRVDPAI